MLDPRTPVVSRFQIEHVLSISPFASGPVAIHPSSLRTSSMSSASSTQPLSPTTYINPAKRQRIEPRFPYYRCYRRRARSDTNHLIVGATPTRPHIPPRILHRPPHLITIQPPRPVLYSDHQMDEECPPLSTSTIAVPVDHHHRNTMSQSLNDVFSTLSPPPTQEEILMSILGRSCNLR